MLRYYIKQNNGIVAYAMGKYKAIQTLKDLLDIDEVKHPKWNDRHGNTYVTGKIGDVIHEYSIEEVNR